MSVDTQTRSRRADSKEVAGRAWLRACKPCSADTRGLGGEVAAAADQGCHSQRGSALNSDRTTWMLVL